MKLQTNIPFDEAKHQFGYNDKLLLLGSCFAENIGDRLLYHKFQSLVNPFGVLFHPMAISQIIEEAISDAAYSNSSVFDHDGIWKYFGAHSSLNALSKKSILENLNHAQKELRLFLEQASHICITLGTAWVYTHKESGLKVANCHKLPQKEFEKSLMKIEEVAEALDQIRKNIRSLNPKAQIIWTVSPVRHLKDGFVENTRSKAHLIAAVHEIGTTSDSTYFPAYEIMLDELRDYRFYASDMLHPSEQAIDYIWEKFLQVYAFAKAQPVIKEVAAIQKGLEHRPFQPESEAQKKFEKQLADRVLKIQQNYPHIEF